MKSYWIKGVANGTTTLELRDIPVPVPGPGQLLLKVRATSLNRGDILATIARHKADVARPGGVDAAGEVCAVGIGVTAFAVGDRVMARAKGSFSEYVLVESALATLIPERLGWEQAAAVPIAFITAWEAMIQYGRIKVGEWLLVAGASSGVGVSCIQAGKYLGVKTIGVSRSAEKLKKLKDIGLDVAICADSTSFAPAVLEATDGKGANVAVNLIGGTAFTATQDALCDFGRLIVVGYVDGVMNANLNLEVVHAKRLEIAGISNTPLTTADRAKATAGFNRDFLPGLIDGLIRPMVDRVFAFDRLSEAKAYVESNALLGKVIVTLP
ncbi:MAG: zinc-binding dehydrogenase [Burkholderiales bacterium]|nr:zinc-binding dehydrogenase [Burkholderiales bacterium]